jgi:hypothetical protein
LKGVTAVQTHRVALCLLRLNGEEEDAPITPANGMLESYGVSQSGKWRALAELERIGLIAIERRGAHRPPVVRLNML